MTIRVTSHRKRGAGNIAAKNAENQYAKVAARPAAKKLNLKRRSPLANRVKNENQVKVKRIVNA